MATQTSSGSTRSSAALLCALAALALGGAALFFGSRGPKIAFVRSQQLVYDYAGMKEAQSSYESKQQRWQTELDSLTSNHREAVSRFNTDAPSMAPKEREARAAELRKQQEFLEKHSYSLKGQAQEEDQKMTQGVLNQINTFVADYGKEHGYDMILGTTQSGNLLYGREGLDITDEVLVALNASYKNGGKAGK